MCEQFKKINLLNCSISVSKLVAKLCPLTIPDLAPQWSSCMVCVFQESWSVSSHYSWLSSQWSSCMMCVFQESWSVSSHYSWLSSTVKQLHGVCFRSHDLCPLTIPDLAPQWNSCMVCVFQESWSLSSHYSSKSEEVRLLEQFVVHQASLQLWREVTNLLNLLFISVSQLLLISQFVVHQWQCWVYQDYCWQSLMWTHTNI